MFTRLSVHCAERMVATNSSSGLVKSSSQWASGYILPSFAMTAAACSLSCWPFLSFIPLQNRNVKPHLPQDVHKIAALTVSVIFVRVDAVLVGVFCQALFQPNCSPGVIICGGFARKIHLINERH